jgi:hypothetical protein
METFTLRPKPDRRRQPRIPPTDVADRIHQRIRAEYLEMPGLHLTAEQARRLCGVEQALCQQVLDTLVEMKYLSLKPNGTYARVTGGPDEPRQHQAKADLRAAPPAKQAS